MEAALHADDKFADPKRVSVRPEGRTAELTSDEQALLVAFDTHWEAAKTGDFQTFLSGCTAGSRADQTPASAASKFGQIIARLDVTPDGFDIINRNATVLDPITAFVEGNVAEYGEIRKGYQSVDYAWLWTTEGGEWVDGVCSIGGK